MNIIDIILTALLIFAFAKGFMKGFFVEVASLLALILGIYGAIHFSYLVADILNDYVSWQENYISLTSFAITFIIIVILITMSGKALTKIADFAALGLINKVLGGVFSLLKSLIILSVLLLFFHKINNTIALVDKEKLENSILYTPVKEIVPMIFPDLFEEYLSDDNIKDTLI